MISSTNFNFQPSDGIKRRFCLDGWLMHEILWKKTAFWSNEEWGERRASNQCSCAIHYLCGVFGWKGEARWNYGKPFSAQLNNLGMFGRLAEQNEFITVQIKTHPKFNDGKIMLNNRKLITQQQIKLSWYSWYYFGGRYQSKRKNRIWSPFSIIN